MNRRRDFEVVSFEKLEDRDVDFIVATAVEVEKDAVLDELEAPLGRERALEVPCNETTYFLGRIGRYKVAVVFGEAGSDTRAGSALEVKDALARWRASAVLMVGIAFGCQEAKQVFGDVLVASQVIPYAHIKATESGDIHRGHKPPTDLLLFNRAKNLQWTWTHGGEERKPQFGPLLSGPTLVNRREYRDHLCTEHPTAIGGEMEGAGLFAACDRARIPWIIFKAVCDWGYGKGDSAQALAAANATSFLRGLLEKPGLEREHFNSTSSTSSASADALGARLLDATHTITFTNVTDRIRAANEKLSLHMHEMMKAAQRGTASPEEVAALRALHASVLENQLNAYDDGASRCLAGEVPHRQFIDTFGVEILSLVANPSIEGMLKTRGPGHFSALRRLHERLALRDAAKLTEDPGRGVQTTPPASAPPTTSQPPIVIQNVGGDVIVSTGQSGGVTAKNVTAVPSGDKGPGTKLLGIGAFIVLVAAAAALKTLIVPAAAAIGSPPPSTSPAPASPTPRVRLSVDENRTCRLVNDGDRMKNVELMHGFWIVNMRTRKYHGAQPSNDKRLASKPE